MKNFPDYAWQDVLSIVLGMLVGLGAGLLFFWKVG